VEKTGPPHRMDFRENLYCGILLKVVDSNFDAAGEK
jgi:hypothetical protein